MDAYLATVLELSPWHWFTLAIILAGFEIVSMSFFLLFPAGAAVIVGLAFGFEPDLDWRLQLVLFAVISVAATVIGRPYLVRVRQGTPAETVNVRGRLYVGRRIRLAAPLDEGRGRIQIDDGWWNVVSESGETIAAAELVEVTGVEGATIRVRAVGQ